MNEGQKDRLKRSIREGSRWLAIGLAYAVFVSLTKVGIPCPIHLVTGFQCPGCGVTRMCLALLHLDFQKAYTYNQGLFISLPILGSFLLWHFIRYIKTGSRQLTTAQNILCCVLLIYYILFGIYRNL